MPIAAPVLSITGTALMPLSRNSLAISGVGVSRVTEIAGEVITSRVFMWRYPHARSTVQKPQRVARSLDFRRSAPPGQDRRSRRPYVRTAAALALHSTSPYNRI